MTGRLRVVAAMVAWMVACAAALGPVTPARGLLGGASQPEQVPEQAPGQVDESEVALAPVDPLAPPARFHWAGYPPGAYGDGAVAALGLGDAERTSPFPGISGAPRPTLTGGLAELQGEPPLLTANLAIPPLALAAYRAAEIQSPSLGAGCYVPWQVLAGIGKVESGHATFGGTDTTVRPDGTVDGPIIGPALTGDTGTARIPDTDEGVLDEDREWDRAVGPMQFIPASWLEFGQDANGDGVADPNNLFDAATSAAAHLCETVPGDYRTDAGRLAQAIYSYNHSAAYVSTVLGWINAYRGVEAPGDAPTVTPVAPPTRPPVTVAQAPPPPRATSTTKPAARPSPPRPSSAPPEPSEPSTGATGTVSPGPSAVPSPQPSPSPDPVTASEPTSPPEPTWRPPAVRLVVEGSDARHADAVRAPAMVAYTQDLVAAVNASDRVAVAGLLGDVDDAEAMADTLVADRETNGRLAPARIAMTYTAGEAPVALTVDVWREPAPDATAPDTNPPDTTASGTVTAAADGTDEISHWITAEFAADGSAIALSMVADESDGSATPTPTVAPTPDPLTPEATAEPTATPTPTSTPGETSTSTATPTPSPSPSQTASPAPTETPSTSRTPTEEPSPAPTEESPTPQPTVTADPTPSHEPTEESSEPTEESAPVDDAPATEEVEPWEPPAPKLAVDGPVDGRPEPAAIMALVDRLATAASAGDRGILASLLAGVEQADALAAALAWDDDRWPARVAVTYPEDRTRSVEVVVSVWLPPAGTGDEATEDAWVAFTLDDSGEINALQLR